MKTYIALLKGINVGGHKKVPMAELRDLLIKLQFENVQTYIQSGNVVFQTLYDDSLKLEQVIQDAIQSKFGFEVSVLIKTREQLKTIFDGCPFEEETKKASYFMMLHDVPSGHLIKEASEKVYEGEEYLILKSCIYYYCKKGYGQAKFNVNLFERKLKTFATARSYNTLVKLLLLSEKN